MADDQGSVFKPDVNKKLLGVKVKALQLLEIEQFLDRDAQFTQKSLQEWWTRIVQFRWDIRDIFGITLTEKTKPIAAAQRLLNCLGLSLEYLGRFGSRGDRQRVYRGCNVDPDKRGDVFAAWSLRDGQKSVSTTCNNNSIMENA